MRAVTGRTLWKPWGAERLGWTWELQVPSHFVTSTLPSQLRRGLPKSSFSSRLIWIFVCTERHVCAMANGSFRKFALTTLVNDGTLHISVNTRTASVGSDARVRRAILPPAPASLRWSTERLPYSCTVISGCGSEKKLVDCNYRKQAPGRVHGKGYVRCLRPWRTIRLARQRLHSACLAKRIATGDSQQVKRSHWERPARAAA